MSAERKGTALITGASGGIGLCLARLFAKDGYDLILAARSADRLSALKAELEAQHDIRIFCHTLDLSETGAARRLFDLTEGAGYPVDILVNNAGVGSGGPFLDRPLPELQAMVALNVQALTESCHLFGNAMRTRGRGRILNLASVAAFLPGPNMGAYYASKAYVLSLTEALSEELRGSGVTLTALCPGPTDTGFASAARVTDSKAFSLFPLGKADAVALRGYKALMKGKVVAKHGLSTYLIAFGCRLAPRTLLRRLAGKVNGNK